MLDDKYMNLKNNKAFINAIKKCDIYCSMGSIGLFPEFQTMRGANSIISEHMVCFENIKAYFIEVIIDEFMGLGKNGCKVNEIISRLGYGALFNLYEKARMDYREKIGVDLGEVYLALLNISENERANELASAFLDKPKGIIVTFPKSCYDEDDD